MTAPVGTESPMTTAANTPPIPPTRSCKATAYTAHTLPTSTTKLRRKVYGRRANGANHNPTLTRSTTPNAHALLITPTLPRSSSPKQPRSHPRKCACVTSSLPSFCTTRTSALPRCILPSTARIRGVLMSKTPAPTCTRRSFLLLSSRTEAQPIPQPEISRARCKRPRFPTASPFSGIPCAQTP